MKLLPRVIPLLLLTAMWVGCAPEPPFEAVIDDSASVREAEAAAAAAKREQSIEQFADSLRKLEAQELEDKALEEPMASEKAKPNQNVAIERAPYVQTERDRETMQLANFEEFWADFRIAVMITDLGALRKSSVFPLKTKDAHKGTSLDAYSSAQFSTLIDLFLKEEIFKKKANGKRTKTSQGRIITNMIFLEEGSDDASFNVSRARVGGMEFTKVDGGWKLTTLYLRSKTQAAVYAAL